MKLNKPEHWTVCFEGCEVTSCQHLCRNVVDISTGRSVLLGEWGEVDTVNLNIVNTLYKQCVRCHYSTVLLWYCVTVLLCYFVYCVYCGTIMSIQDSPVL